MQTSNLKSKMAAPINKTPQALSLKVLAECSTTKARTCKLKLPHYTVDTPVFMPVGTQGTMKSLTTSQLENVDAQLILGNTYHLGMRPVCLFVYFVCLLVCWKIFPCNRNSGNSHKSRGYFLKTPSCHPIANLYYLWYRNIRLK